ncbi:membrane protein [Gammaproteobacteria bacterium]|nr:membrane protein [Gammaproteobacteria bacterium]
MFLINKLTIKSIKKECAAISRLITVSLSLVFMLSVFNLSFSQNLKIGVISANFLLENAPQTQRFREVLTSEFAPREVEINQAVVKLRSLQSELNIATDGSDKNILLNEINRLNRDINRLDEDYRQDYNLRKNEELLKVQKEVSDAVLKFAQEENFDLILESDVIYAADKLIVTKAILERLK